MTGCDRCSGDRTFLFTCPECGGRYCESHRAPAEHLCITFPALGSSEGSTGPDGAAPPRLGRALQVGPAGAWLLAVLLVDRHGLALGPVGTLALVAFGSVALWLAAASIPRVGSWMHADR